MFNNRHCGCMNMRNNCECERNACEKPCCVTEAPINNCVQRNICHEVKHIVPIHTHMIDRHIYNHTYVPQYSCSHENQVINNDPCMGQFNA
jgi:hypothetical protein